MLAATAHLAAAAIGCGAWLLAHAYQHARFSAYEREDRRMIADPGREGFSSWLEAVKRQVGICAVSPEACRELAASGELGEPYARAARSGFYARRYDPTLTSDLRWLPAYLVASYAGAWAAGPAGAAFTAALTATAQADSRFRAIPLPHAAVIFASGSAFWGAFPGCLAGMSAATLALAAVAAAFGFAARRLGATWGSGDTLLLPIVCAAVLPTGQLPVMLAGLAVCAAIAAVALRSSGEGSATALAPLLVVPVVACLLAVRP